MYGLLPATPQGGQAQSGDKAIDKLKHYIRTLSVVHEAAVWSIFVAELRIALLGWKAYFGIAEVLSALREIDNARSTNGYDASFVVFFGFFGVVLVFGFCVFVVCLCEKPGFCLLLF